MADFQESSQLCLWTYSSPEHLTWLRNKANYLARLHLAEPSAPPQDTEGATATDNTTTTTTTTPPSPAAAAAMQIPQSTEESLFSPSSHLSPVVGRASIERLSHYRPTRRPPSSSASASARHSDVSMDLSMGSFVSFSSPTSRTG
uniref:Uncharacterized protein n=1 Tax=Amphora coffeiformis TaxID=265554 RepID=A0A7S3P5L7_9STRA